MFFSDSLKMACQEFTVLYTHQKMKKSKVWQDGILKFTVGGNKAFLYDDKGQVLDSIFVKLQVKSGDDLESERYLITVETEKNPRIGGGTGQPKNTDVSLLTTKNLKSSASSVHLPIGLKRKFTGFQGPRHVEKKMATVEEPVAVVSPRHLESSFPSQLFASSPLFSVAYQKKEETNLLPGIKGDAVMSSRDTELVTSLACTHYSDNHKVIKNVSCIASSADTEHLTPESHLDTGPVNLNHHTNNNVAVSQNIRSTGQIIALLRTKTALLNREQRHPRTPQCEYTTSMSNQPLTKFEFHPEVLPLSEPSRSADVLFQQKLSPVLGSVNSTINKSIKDIQALQSTAKNLQTHSRWDAYLPSHVPEEYPDQDAIEHNDNVSDLQPVIKDLKEGGSANRDQYSKDNKKFAQIPASLEISVSPFSESSFTKQPHSSTIIKSSMNVRNDTEGSFDSIQNSDCINALEACDANLSKSNKHSTADNLETFCCQSQNEPCQVVSSENFSGCCTYGELDDPAKQFIQVNFDVLDVQDFSDTEDGECNVNSTLSQHSVCLKAVREISVEKKTCMSEGKDNLQSAFLQDDNVNCALQSCDKMSENAKKDMTKCNFPSEHSEATVVDEMLGAKKIGALKVDAHKDLDCIGSDSMNVISYVHPHSNTYFMDKNNKGIEAGGNNSQLPSIHISDDMTLASPLLAKNNTSSDFPQYITDKQYVASGNSYDLGYRPRTRPLDCETFSDETYVHKDELGDTVSASDAFYKSTEENEKQSSSADSSSLPKLINGFSLLRSLTEHSTALESLQMIEESTGMSCQRGAVTEEHVSRGGPKAKQWFAEVSYSEDVLMSSSCSGAPKMPPSLSNDEEKHTAPIVKVLHGQSPIRMAESQSVGVSELSFPSAEMINCTDLPKRQMCIPAEFKSSALYKQVFTAALTEHLNILLFELSQRLHKALGKVDISFYTSAKEGQEQTQENSAPLCNHKIAAKLVMVKKQGRNKGRLFYTCDAPKAERCDFFKWLDDVNPGQIKVSPKVIFHDIKSIGTYLRSQHIFLHEECQLLVRKAYDIQRKQFSKLKRFNVVNAEFDCDSRNKLYLKLNKKEHSSMYSKDDLWVVSKTLMFEPLDTFIACSVFFGPSSSNEIELEPLKGYSPSNWRSNMIVHALLVCNASTELTTLRNIEEHFNSATLPIMQHLLTKPFKEVPCSNRGNKRKFKPPVLNTNTINYGLLSPEMTISLANKLIQTFQLNKDQAMALLQIGSMMALHPMGKETGKQQPLPITVIHGVFGSGKSYLLAIVILFLVQIFETTEASDGKRLAPWKILISSSTNVAVDRVLLCLLDLGFEEFIRVGSIRKIAKPVLPYSLHAGSGPESEQLKELLALMKEDLTPAEKNYVRKTIEHHRLGTNKSLLQQVKVVGVTCAACPFPCMKNLKFPVVVLDECSQMTEPASLLPIARFGCEKLILVGDPKQLPPTIQGSESAHDNGLEQTLFDRLCLMGHEPVLLRTQYRCHPAISAISNNLFYGGNLLDGVSDMDRNPLVDWLPTLCFYSVNGSEQMEKDNSFYNMAESFFTVKLIQSLIASGIEGSMIGVITLYKSQMSKICNLLAAVYSDASQVKAVQVSTVDAFQGAEKDIIVLSCVRTRHVGFIDSESRVNVALTRGKRHLLIVGNLNCLRKNKLWGNVIQHCAGCKDGLQHVSQCEQKLNDILTSYMEMKKEEEKKQKEKSKSKSLSQKTNV
ncbi:protein ZGRF1 [Eublepharis macularius]|uniref:5'-3' DNA helicase ZGRF1 n=1 Tax=Eublepharis macularius TaxID=481883 RepID=A0AA97L947_EUBMA|nr:protein ZGRF1 [Eublepharis macularius]